MPDFFIRLSLTGIILYKMVRFYRNHLQYNSRSKTNHNSFIRSMKENEACNNDSELSAVKIEANCIDVLRSVSHFLNSSCSIGWRASTSDEIIEVKD